jgi:glycerol-1-phosphate dehydrogenase [NAD(P)+]
VFNQSTVSMLADRLSAVPKLVMEKTIAQDIDDLVGSILPPMKLVVVDDADTAEALGSLVSRALSGRYPCTHVTLDDPVADEVNAGYLRTQTLSADALVAVGSGTINDLCKYVSHIDRKPYITFPTAASMNGYLSANASITMAQHKKTLPAHMPIGVFCDLGVISKAPPRLSKAGLGDSLARSTAQADWLLSHLLLDTDYDELPFALLAPYEEALFAQARGIGLLNMESIEQLMKVLLLSGLGMTIAGGSYPASQSEHMIAHAYDMLLHHRMRDYESQALHGEEVGVTTLATAAMQERFLRKAPHIRPDDFDSKTMIHNYGSKIATQARQAFDGKQQLIEQADRKTKEAISGWEAIAEKIASVILTSAEIESILKAADAPTTSQKIKWQDDAYDTATNTARYLRERFTFLDLDT